MPVSKLLKLPYGSYLMVRLDYRIICGDELEAKIMRIIEMYIDMERISMYRNMLNDPKQNIDPDTEVEVTKDIWIAISHRLFKNDLYDQDMSENTLKRAIKSLTSKKFIKVRDDRKARYEAPKYQINIDVVQKELDTLAKMGKSEYQKLMVSKIDGIKNSSRQKMTPGDHQNLTPSRQSMVSKFDPNSRKVTNLVEDKEEGYTEASANASASPALIAHPEHNFIWFDDLVKPSLMVVRYTPAFPSRFFSEYEDKRRSRRADEIRCVFEERGINVRVRYEHEAVDETTVEAEEYIPQFNYLQDIRKTEQQASGMIVVVDSELAARSEEAQHDSYSPAPSLGYEKEKTYGGVGMATRSHHYGSAASGTGEHTDEDQYASSQHQSSDAEQSAPGRRGAARTANTGRGTGGKGRGTGKSKAVTSKIYFSLEGAAFRQWWEELTGATVDETAANAAACNKVGKKASATYENTKLVVDEIRANKWVKTNRVAVTPQDLANDTSNLRWEKWLQPAQQSRAQKPPTREEDPYSVAALLEEQNPGYHARKEAMSRGDYSFADILSANS